MDFELIIALRDTFIMILIPSIFSVIFGILIGSIIFLTQKDAIYENKVLNNILNIFINIIRSFPFLIFVIVLLPLTRLIFGTGFGLLPATFPLTFVAIAIYSRFVEQSFYDVNPEIIELAISLNASPFQLIYNFMLVEARGSLILGFTSCIISLFSYSSVMGIVGGGGIGDYALRYGYYEYNYVLVYKVVSIILFIVIFIQKIGEYISKKVDKKRRRF